MDTCVCTKANYHNITIIICYVFIILMMCISLYIYGNNLEFKTNTMIKKMKDDEEESLPSRISRALNIKIPKFDELPEDEKIQFRQTIDRYIEKCTPCEQSWF